MVGQQIITVKERIVFNRLKQFKKGFLFRDFRSMGIDNEMDKYKTTE